MIFCGCWGANLISFLLFRIVLLRCSALWLQQEGKMVLLVVVFLSERSLHFKSGFLKIGYRIRYDAISVKLMGKNIFVRL